MGNFNDEILNEDLCEDCSDTVKKTDVDKKCFAVPYEKIEINSLNDFQICDIDILADNIQKRGLLIPLTLIGPSKDGMYKIISGERRYLAIGKIRESHPNFYDYIPAYISGPYDMDAVDQKIKISACNIIVRENVDMILSKFKYLKALHEKYSGGINSESKLNSHISSEAAKEFNCSDRYMRMFNKVLIKADEKIQEAVVNQIMSIETASKLAVLDKEEQLKALDDVKNGMPAKIVIKKYLKKNESNSELNKKTIEENNSCTTSKINNDESIEEFTEETSDIESLSDEDYEKEYFESDYSKEDVIPDSEIDVFDIVDAKELSYEYDEQSEQDSSVDKPKDISFNIETAANLLDDDLMLESLSLNNVSIQDIKKEKADEPKINNDIDTDSSFDFESFVNTCDMKLNTNIDTTGTYDRLNKSRKGVNDEKYIRKLHIISNWCLKIKEVNEHELTDEEYAVIEIMKEVVDKFS